MKPYHLIILSFLLMLSCEKKSAQETPQMANAHGATTPNLLVSFSDQERKNAGVETGPPAEENLSQTLMLQGKIDVPPQSTISLSFPLGGYLKSTKMLPGMQVRKGETLAELEDMQFIQLQQDYLTAKEKLMLFETEFERQRDLNASKASSDRAFQQARTEMETQRILMNALGQKLELIGILPQKLSATNIRKSVSIISPINGFVSKVNVNVGKYTAPTDMLFELVDPRDIHLSLNVFEKDLNSLSIGQLVTAYTNAEPDKKFQARIILISKNLNQDRVAEVHCHFDKYSPTLVPGMFMNGNVNITESKSLTVAEDAVVRWENKFYVFVEKGNEQFQMTEIQPSNTKNGKQQISATEISTSTNIVTKNAYSLLMKIKNSEEEG